MRKVIVFESTQNPMTHNWEKGRVGFGMFHQWGTELIEGPDDCFTYSVAIVEMEDGEIKMVQPNYIQFVKEVE